MLLAVINRPGNDVDMDTALCTCQAWGSVAVNEIFRSLCTKVGPLKVVFSCVERHR